MSLDDELRRLGDQPVDRPPFSAVTSRAGAIRRRRRVVMGGGVAAALLVAVGIVAVATQRDDDGGQVVTEPPGSSSTTTTEAPTTTSPSTTTTAGTATTTTGPPPVDATTTIPDLEYDAVSATEDGLELRTTGGEIVPFGSGPMAIGFALEGPTLVYQAAEEGDLYPRTPSGDVVVVTPTGRRVGIAPSPPTARLRLYDAVVVDGRPIVLAAETTGSSPEDTVDVLLSIDVESGEVTPIAEVGGWESSAFDARFSRDGYVLLRSQGADIELVGLDSAGRTRWSDVVGTDMSVSIGAGLDSDRIVLFAPGFDSGEPVIEIRQLVAATGEELDGSSATNLTGDVVPQAGFCFRPARFAGFFICDQSSGPPFAFDPSGVTFPIEGLTRAGTITRPPPTLALLPSPCAIVAAPPEVWTIARALDLDGDRVADATLAALSDPQAGPIDTVQAFAGGRPTAPVTFDSPGFPGALAVADVNDDGHPEVFLDGWGNTARSAVMLTFDGCDFHLVRDDAGDMFLALIGVGGNSCAPIGCRPRVRCIAGGDGTMLELAIVEPSRLGQPGEVDLAIDRYVLDGTTMTLLDQSAATYPDLDALPADAPQPEESDRIDCPAPSAG